MKIVKFEYSLFGINTYIVFDPESKECVIIDPGMINDEERAAMQSFIAKNGLTVTNIINTHLHIDHAIGNAWAKKMFDVPTKANVEDSPLGERMKQQAAMFGIPANVADVSIDIPL
ncbi:MAG: MBL fold metallo-hydrolase, partial [Muribaculaceae bacterium]|nr:MBL fold metallo-hydrolase [Muribaculaceae bacterium]